ncbi:MAG: sugar nucleotide-binding protein, partial [candidate division FCPU426 bacterium]
LRGVYHAAGPERMNRSDFGKRLALEFGFPTESVLATSMDDFVFDDPRPKECSLNIEKLGTAIGYKPLDVAQGLRTMHDQLLTLR